MESVVDELEYPIDQSGHEMKLGDEVIFWTGGYIAKGQIIKLTGRKPRYNRRGRLTRWSGWPAWIEFENGGTITLRDCRKTAMKIILSKNA